MNMKVIFCFALIFVGISNVYSILYVDASVSAQGDGSSWQNAYKYLQDAINSAPLGSCEIWVRAGVYEPDVNLQNPTGTGNTDTYFEIPLGVELYGGFGGFETSRNQRNAILNRTIISGEIGDNDSNLDNSHTVIVMDSNSIVDGFYVQNGTIGISCPMGTQSIIQNCIIQENEDGIVLYLDATVTIIANVIRNNLKNGISSIMGKPTIKNNSIYENDNGICYIGYTSHAVTNNTIASNTLNGILSRGCEEPLVANCILWGNGDDLNECVATYSCISDADSGTGNISSYPFFVDITSRDFQLETWSPCIDAGDSSDYSNEPNYPVGKINMGAYGNTALAQTKSLDTDQDGLPDDWEMLYFGDLLRGANDFPDSNDLTNLEELYYGTDPNNSDTDGDGMSDFWEIQNGYDPLNPEEGPDPDIDTPIPATPLWDCQPYASSNTSISMVAGESWDRSNVEYFFECYSGGGHDSDWQESPIYTDTNLTPNVTYSYRIRVRDKSGNNNMTPNYSMVASATTLSRIIYVNNEIAIGGNGSSWQNAYKYLQDALTAATAGIDTEIWVAVGTYNPDRSNSNPEGSGLRSETFILKDRVSLYGGFLGEELLRQERNWNVNETVLSGYVGDGSNKAYHVVDGYAATIISDATVLDGFTIRDGYADGGRSGGAIRLQDDSLVISNCIFLENDASEYGACIYINNSSESEAGNPKILDCVFVGKGSSDAIVDDGSAISAVGCKQLDIKGCVFLDHYTDVAGGAIFLQAAAYAMDVNVNECLFENNNGTRGGGICGQGEQLSLVAKDCIFRGNVAVRADYQHRGGAVCLYGGKLDMNRCVFIGNLAKYGSGIFIDCVNESSVNKIDNCIFIENTCEVAGDNYGSGIHIEAGTTAEIAHCVFQQNANHALYIGSTLPVSISDCIIWNNEKTLKSVSANTVVSYCNIQGCGSPDYWNLTPCVDGGNNLDLIPNFYAATLPEGEDNDFFTADDGVRLHYYSPLRGQASDGGHIGIQYMNDNNIEKGYYWPLTPWRTSPYCSNTDTITLEVADVAEITGDIWYQIEEETQGIFSDWQMSRQFTFTGLVSGVNYSFRMRIMDESGKIYDWSISAEASTETIQDVTPPVFIGPDWIDILPISSTSIELAPGQAQIVGSIEPMEYLVERVTPEGTIPLGGWQSNPYFTDTGLQPNITYYYVGHVRDSWLNTVSTSVCSCTTLNENDALAVYTGASNLQWRKTGDLAWNESGQSAYYPGAGGQNLQIEFNNNLADVWVDQPNISVLMSTTGTTARQQIVSNINSTNIKKVGIGGDYATIDDAVASFMQEAQDPTQSIPYNWDVVVIQLMAQPNPHVLKKSPKFYTIKNYKKRLKLIIESDPEATVPVVVDFQKKCSIIFKSPFSGSIIRNLTLKNLANTGIVAASADLTIENCIIKGCNSLAISVAGKPIHTLTLKKTQFEKLNPDDDAEVFCRKAAVYARGLSTEIRECTIKDCLGKGVSQIGGAIKITGSIEKPCEISGCGNCAVYIAGSSSTVNIDYCDIRDNAGGGLYLAIAGKKREAIVQRSHFESNSSKDGGAITTRVCSYASLVVDKCKFMDNQALKYRGGAICCTNSRANNVNITNCEFSKNTAGSPLVAYGRGAAVYLVAGKCIMSHCTVADNMACSSLDRLNGYGGAFYINGDLQIRNSIVYSNTADYGHEIALGKRAKTTLAWSCVQDMDDNGVESGRSIYKPIKAVYDYLQNNMQTTPLFSNQTNGDYHLSESPLSPCIDYAPVDDIAGPFDIDNIDRMNHPLTPVPEDISKIADIGSYEVVTSIPGVVSLCSPENDQEDVSLTPLLGWQHAPYASQYDIYIDNTQIASVPQGTYQYEVLSPLNPFTSYNWKIYALNSKGTSSSDTRSFRTTALSDIGGIVYNDQDENGQYDSGADLGIEGWRVFVDLNGDGIWQMNEPYDITNAQGYYGICGLSSGTYRLVQEIRVNWRESIPANGVHEITLSGTNIPDLNFGNMGYTWISPTTINVLCSLGQSATVELVIENRGYSPLGYTIEFQDVE